MVTILLPKHSVALTVEISQDEQILIGVITFGENVLEETIVTVEQNVSELLHTCNKHVWEA